eukprot:1681713-Rhodomonas_salina.2
MEDCSCYEELLQKDSSETGEPGSAGGPFGGCPRADGRMSPSTAGRREKHRLWKAAERARKKIARQQTDVSALPFSARKQCSTTFCNGNGTPLR